MSHIYPDLIAGPNSPYAKMFSGMPATYNQQAEAAMLQATIPITLRDYFAAAALTGLIAGRNHTATYDEAAETAYRTADAMLKVRGGTK